MEIGNREIGRSVTIEVVHGYENRVIIHGEILGGLEGAIAVAEQYGDGGVKMVGNHQVLLAIAIEIADSHKIRMCHARTRERLRRLEGAIAVAQKHRQSIVIQVG